MRGSALTADVSLRRFVVRSATIPVKAVTLCGDAPTADTREARQVVVGLKLWNTGQRPGRHRRQRRRAGSGRWRSVFLVLYLARLFCSTSLCRER